MLWIPHNIEKIETVYMTFGKFVWLTQPLLSHKIKNVLYWADTHWLHKTNSLCEIIVRDFYMIDFWVIYSAFSKRWGHIFRYKRLYKTCFNIREPSIICENEYVTWWIESRCHDTRIPSSLWIKHCRVPSVFFLYKSAFCSISVLQMQT